MNYRLAEASDIPRLIELRNMQMIDEGYISDEDISEDIGDFFAANLADGRFVCWLAEDDGEVIATAGVNFYRLPPTHSNPSGLTAHIGNMFTLASHRRRGIASHLLGLIIGEAVSRGCLIIRLHASPDAEKLYRMAGFVDADGDMVLKF